LAVIAYVRNHQVTAAEDITGVNGADIPIITSIVDNAVGTSCIGHTDIDRTVDSIGT